MALLPILTHPNERLHIVAKPVAEVDDRIRTLVADMAETMYAAKGIGLAATQVDVHERVVVIDLSEEHNQLLALINPTITKKDGETTFEEGCLSVPGFYEDVTRAEFITVQFQDRAGNTRKMDASELLAVCIQHEMDHLDGHLFIERIGYNKRKKFDKEFKKSLKEKSK